MAKKPAKRPKIQQRPDRFVSQASAEALVRYGPRLGALEQLQAEALGQYRSGVENATQGRIAVQASVDQVIPQIEQTWQTLGVGPGGGDTPFAKLLSQQRASTFQDLQARKVRAAEAEVQQRAQAQAQLGENLGKVDAERRSIADEIGAFTTATAGTLRGQNAERQQAWKIANLNADTSRRGQDLELKKFGLEQSAEDRRFGQEQANEFLQEGIDPATGQYLPGRAPSSKGGGARTGAKGQKLADPKRHEEKASYVSELQNAIKTEIQDVKEANPRLKGKALRSAVARSLQKELPKSSYWQNEDGEIMYSQP